MDFSRRCPRFHHANSRPTLSRLQRARRKNLYLSLEYTTFCLKKQVKKTISTKVQNLVTFPVHSRFKFGADVPLLPNGDIAHARRSDAPARMGVSLIEKQRLFPDGKRQKASSLRRTVQRQLDTQPDAPRSASFPSRPSGSHADESCRASFRCLQKPHHAVCFRALPFLHSSMLTATAEIAMLTMTHLKASASLSVRHIW